MAEMADYALRANPPYRERNRSQGVPEAVPATILLA
jgi:hypothetical protein